MYLAKHPCLIPLCIQEDSRDVKFENHDFHIDAIYAKYGMNAEYNRIYPIYLNPTNPTQYILLTC
ncbi:uncharacterized protein VP01_1679g6 [Puccinia sorghi]|uniref:Uncharacterized protein n=1 Tax=Puccinia sorghi TaxID=27349 RepID=A0A0L6VG21_9BASI|nr:uncharacterized protein VP01_1679g6 [Puccinia sorghi]